MEAALQELLLVVSVCARLGQTVGSAVFFTSSILLALTYPVNGKSEQCSSHWKLCQEMVPGIEVLSDGLPSTLKS